MASRSPAWGLAGLVCLLLVSASPAAQAFSLGAIDLALALPRPFSRLFLGQSLSRAEQQHRCRSELEELRRWHASLGGEEQLPEPVHDSPEAEPAAAVASAGSRRLLAEKEDESLPLEAQWSRSAVKKAVRDWETLGEDDMRRIVKEQKEQLGEIQERIEDYRAKLQSTKLKKNALDSRLAELRPDFSEYLLTKEVMDQARSMIDRCSESGMVLTKQSPVWKGYACRASDEALSKYLSYQDRGMCPDDWPATQHMVFVDSCFALPKRRCLTPTSESFTEPTPFPQSLFDQTGLRDENVRWTNHECKSFLCLNSRTLGDCTNCFNMRLEKNRWKRVMRGSLPMKEVIDMKKGTLRIGLDAGGGTGSFAAHMALHGVTVMSTAMNIETIDRNSKGLPYMETIALRGLIPLHVPHKSRLPFFDNTLDIIHCINSVKYLPMLEFEELLFEWDRVLRVGGVMWFEMFYAPLVELPIYVALIERLGYKKLYWNVTPKPDFGEVVGVHAYLNCVIEKPVRPDSSSKKGWLA